jgi:cytochrome P450
LVNFSRGTRACLGINLAYAEIYLTLAAVFRRFDLELFETTREDVDIVHDFFSPSARLDSKGVRVLVK